MSTTTTAADDVHVMMEHGKPHLFFTVPDPAEDEAAWYELFGLDAKAALVEFARIVERYKE